jgi:hypothetical protein
MWSLAFNRRIGVNRICGDGLQLQQELFRGWKKLFEITPIVEICTAGTAVVAESFS